MMSDATLARLAKLDRAKLLRKLAELERQRRVVVALVRALPRADARRRAVRG
jgi:hypothetical protein